MSIAQLCVCVILPGVALSLFFCAHFAVLVPLYVVLCWSSVTCLIIIHLIMLEHSVCQGRRKSTTRPLYAVTHSCVLHLPSVWNRFRHRDAEQEHRVRACGCLQRWGSLIIKSLETTVHASIQTACYCRLNSIHSITFMQWLHAAFI